jgi:hypothetical protein
MHSSQSRRGLKRIIQPHPKIKLLKVDKANLDRNGKQHQLFGIGYSAKRYCLHTDKEIIKPSEHGLGPYFVPAYKGEERFWKPADCLKDDVYVRWVKRALGSSSWNQKNPPKVGQLLFDAEIRRHNSQHSEEAATTGSRSGQALFVLHRSNLVLWRRYQGDAVL